MVIEDNNYLGYFGDIWTRLFVDVGNQDPHGHVVFKYYPKNIQTYLDLIFKDVEYKKFYDDSDIHFEVKENNKVLLGFSTGSDSFASVYLLREQGYDVTLFHVKNVNRAYPLETKKAQEAADFLGCPLVVYEAKYKGSTPYMENAIKNQYILALMLDYGLKHDFAHYSMGNHYRDAISNAIVTLDYSDSQELFVGFEKYVQNYFPQYRFHTNIKNVSHAYEVLLKHPECLPYIVSCMCPNRFFNSRRQGNIDKYNANLYPNMCGSCRKCLRTYCLLVDKGIIEKNTEFYTKCMTSLREILKKGYEGRIYSNWNTLSDTDVINIHCGLRD